MHGKKKHDEDGELSQVWRELLGEAHAQPVARPAEGIIPTLENDPWSALVHADGTEVVDLQKLDLHMSDQDVERVLQVMQDQPASPPNKDQSK
jgi:hypothetical protein